MELGKRWATLLAGAALASACSTPHTVVGEIAPLSAALASDAAGLEGEAHGFPALRTLEGEKLADGEFRQWIEDERLHLRIRYEFGAGRSVEELCVLRQVPQLSQEHWAWTETRGGAVQRKFEIDFLSGKAQAEQLVDGETHRWSEQVDVEPGRAFAGVGWALAIKHVRARLIQGEALDFQTVGFTPQPRAATVEITHRGVEQLSMSNRNLAGDRFRIHPKIPWLARAFVSVPDSQVWLTNSPPTAFLRFEGPLAEPSDPLVRVDLLPGEPSAAAVARPR